MDEDLRVTARKPFLTTVYLLVIAALVIWLGSLSLPFAPKFTLLLLVTLLIPVEPAS